MTLVGYCRRENVARDEMKTVTILLIPFLAAALSLAAAPARADAVAPVAAKKAVRHHPRHARAKRAAQVACTVYGCHPIPPNCHPVQGYDFWGNPSAFDDVICR